MRGVPARKIEGSYAEQWDYTYLYTLHTHDPNALRNPVPLHARAFAAYIPAFVSR